MFNFEKLKAWHKGIEFAELIYGLTKDFPDAERFGLTSQMRRAAVSVSANLAEGSSRTSLIDHSRFVEIAAGSVFEVVSHATIGLRQGLLSKEGYREIYMAAEELIRMLSGLRRSLRKVEP
jgi:four helix bundle protein